MSKGKALVGMVNRFKTRERYGIIMFNKSAEIETTKRLAGWRGGKLRGSKEQEAIWKAMQTSKSHLVVNALAGTGKTTTCLEGLSRIASQDQLECSTSHSLMLTVWKERQPKVEVKQYKTHDIVNAELGIKRGNHVSEERMQVRDSVVGLVSLLKNTLMEPTKQNIYLLCDQFGLDLGDHEEDIMGYAADCWGTSLDMEDVVDFDDMLFMPAYHRVEPQNKFKFLVVDEAQDYNVAQRVGALLMAERLMFVGDRNQSIYAFRGADAESIPNTIKELGERGAVKELPLTMSRRCPRAVVESVKDLVPEFRAMKNAEEGLVEWQNLGQARQSYRPGDMVLSRCNLPLCSEAFTLLAEGKKCKISGRDFGTTLVRFIKKFKPESVDDLARKVEGYREKELAKLRGKAKYRPVDNLVTALNDKVNCLSIFIKDKQTVDGVILSIECMFDDEIKNRKKIVLLSTIHKAKGDESDRVFILERDMMPGKKAKTESQMQQEKNICYVGHTRAKQELYLVEAPYKMAEGVGD